MKKILFLLVLLLFSPCPLQAQPRTWTAVGTGISSTAAAGGNSVLIAFGGWSVKESWTRNWAEHLDSALGKDLRIGMLYAAAGPASPCYTERELGTPALAAALTEWCAVHTPERIVVVAHSSGSFVAHQFLEELLGPGGADTAGVTAGRIWYFNLDGGTGTGTCGCALRPGTAQKLAQAFGVYAEDSTTGIRSPNREDMLEFAAMFPGKAEALRVEAAGCGCTGRWCLHETLVNRIPLNKKTFDLGCDYLLLGPAHPVQADYLRRLFPR